MEVQCAGKTDFRRWQAVSASAIFRGTIRFIGSIPLFFHSEEYVLIEVKHLTKKYGSFTAVDDISFTVKKGTITGFLGPNGAGKSTTMNMITGCLAATAGSVTINGYDIYTDPLDAKSSIGYLPEIPPLYTDMTPEEYLLFVAEAKGVDPAHLDVQVDKVIARTRLEPVRDRLIKNLSKGYRQRVGIAQAILGDPEIIILDEPTVGLDPLQIIEIRDLIKELSKDHTVILSSHILTEVSAVCDSVIIIAHGHIVAQDTLANLTASADGQRLITVDARGDIQKISAMLQKLPNHPRTSVTYGLGGCVRVTIETPHSVDMREDVFRLFASHDIPIIEMTTNDITLEDVFLRLTDESLFTVESAEEVTETESEDSSAEAKELSDDSPNDAAEESEEDDSPYYIPEKKPKEKEKKNSDNDDYKPLFGSKE